MIFMIFIYDIYDFMITFMLWCSKSDPETVRFGASQDLAPRSERPGPEMGDVLRDQNGWGNSAPFSEGW